MKGEIDKVCGELSKFLKTKNNRDKRGMRKWQKFIITVSAYSIVATCAQILLIMFNASIGIVWFVSGIVMAVYVNVLRSYKMLEEKDD